MFFLVKHKRQRYRKDVVETTGKKIQQREVEPKAKDTAVGNMSQLLPF